MNILETALSQYGVTEIQGDRHNPVILGYASAIGHLSSVISDETAWCSIFINWCALRANLVRSGKLNARSWLDFGDEVKHPMPGDVVILWRESKASWKGHVALYVAEDKDSIYCLGGNQSNQVNISRYPKERLLGYRRLFINETLER